MRMHLKRTVVIALAVVLAATIAIVGFHSTSASSLGASDSSPSTGNNPNQVRSVVASQTRSTNDPSTWSNKRLAAQLVLAGVGSNSLASTHSWSKAGIAGVVLFGNPPGNLKSKIQQTRSKSPAKRLIVASDEEGGAVQRLARLVGRYPSAATIGRTKTVHQTEKLARGLGKKLKRLGVNSDLAPVADLLYRGSWTARDGRAFKNNPTQNGKYVAAFAKGLQRSGVSATVKHWPGGGAVADTHVGAGKTPNWSSLKRRDLVPFTAAFKAGAASVMVSHARVPGLTGGLPATQSARAYQALRQQAGDRVVIMTDSLAMAAVTSSMRQSQTEAAIRALRSGADLALVQGASPKSMITNIAKAISSGKINRAKAVASTKRVLAWQLRFK